jgi:fucose permease
MSWLHCFWGVGTIISPYVMSLALTYSNWNSGYRTVAVIQAIIGIILLSTLGVWKINEKDGKDIARADSGGKIIGIRGALRIKGVPYLLIGFFGYCAAEATVMLWTSSYLVEARGISEEIAAGFTSLFFIGLTFGRFVSGIFADKLSDRSLIRLGTVISIFGMLLILIPTNTDALSFVGFLLIGLGYAPIYPAIIHSTPSNFGAENSQAVIGVQMAFAYMGSLSMPTVCGWLAEAFGYGILPVFSLAITVIMILLYSAQQRIVDAKNA